MPIQSASAGRVMGDFILEVQLQTELDIARRADGRGDDTTGGRVDVRAGRRETGGVGQVENFRTELDLAVFVDSKLFE